MRGTDRLGSIRWIKHKSIVRTDAFAVASLLTTLLAFTTPSCLANTISSVESREIANTGANTAADVPATMFPGSGAGLLAATDGSSADENNIAPAFTAGHPPSALTDLPSAVPNSYQKTGDPKLSAKCVLIPEGFCRAVRNRPIVILASIQTAALISDGVSTRQFLRHGYQEVDPVARIFIGSKPTWARMAPLGAVQVFAGMWLAERMATSQHRWIRRFWWLPQLMGIAGNAAATLHNTALR